MTTKPHSTCKPSLQVTAKPAAPRSQPRSQPKPPKGYRWLRKGEVSKETDFITRGAAIYPLISWGFKSHGHFIFLRKVYPKRKKKATVTRTVKLYMLHESLCRASSPYPHSPFYAKDEIIGTNLDRLILVTLTWEEPRK